MFSQSTASKTGEHHKHFPRHGPSSHLAPSYQRGTYCFCSFLPHQRFISKASYRSTITFPHRSDSRNSTAAWSTFSDGRNSSRGNVTGFLWPEQDKWKGRANRLLWWMCWQLRGAGSAGKGLCRGLPFPWESCTTRSRAADCSHLTTKATFEIHRS